MLLVDAANVVGARPDGWWRDRAGAAGRLVASLRAAVRAGRLDVPVTVVLEGRARAGVAEGSDEGVTIAHAPHDGDTALAALCMPGVVLVTADRELRARAERAGTTVAGPRWLLDRIAAGPDPA